MLETRDLSVLVVSLMCGLPFGLGVLVGWKLRGFQFQWPGLSITWPWEER